MVWLLVVLGLILALGATAVLIGSRRATPSPFGAVGIGTVLYGTADGDIYALDSATNESRALIEGPTLDTRPRYSPDGTHLVFERRIAGAAGVALMVANADGSDATQLVSPIEEVSWFDWSPHSDRIAAIGAVNGQHGLWVVPLDGEPNLVRLEEPGTSIGIVDQPHWLPGGDALLFLAGPMDTVAPTGLYRVQADGTGMVAVVEQVTPGPAELAISPDGTRVAYSKRDGERSDIHIVDLATGADAALAFDGVSIAQNPRWSPDGSRLVFERIEGASFGLAVGSVDGGPVVDIGPQRPDGSGGADAQFLQDGTRIMAFYNADRTAWLLDAAGGDGVQLDSDIVTPGTWAQVTP
jgi:Tol biopolymer transport system component